MLLLGLESGDQQVLDAMDKGISLGLVEKTLANFKLVGIATYVYLLFGTPHETAEKAMITQSFIRGHHDEIDYLNLAIFNMPLNSPEIVSVKTSNFYQGDLSLYTEFEHPHGWNRTEIRQFLDKSFRRDPLIAPIIKRDPMFFTSSHAPFFQHSNKARNQI